MQSQALSFSWFSCTSDPQISQHIQWLRLFATVTGYIDTLLVLCQFRVLHLAFTTNQITVRKYDHATPIAMKISANGARSTAYIKAANDIFVALQSDISRVQTLLLDILAPHFVSSPRILRIVEPAFRQVP